MYITTQKSTNTWIIIPLDIYILNIQRQIPRYQLNLSSCYFYIETNFIKAITCCLYVESWNFFQLKIDQNAPSFLLLPRCLHVFYNNVCNAMQCSYLLFNKELLYSFPCLMFHGRLSAIFFLLPHVQHRTVKKKEAL